MTSRLHFDHGAGRNILSPRAICVQHLIIVFLPDILLLDLRSQVHLNKSTCIYNVLNHILNERHLFRESENETLPADMIQKHDLDCIASNNTLLLRGSYNCVTFHDMQTYQKVACVCSSGQYNRLYMFLLSVLLRGIG